ncbi:amino acid adenylation domain-containing protein [Rhodomicrobium vannielii ATCC 17100]|uniref:Pls/PosA family non-ribosomal peptide synthetase n=1 Tax=Rhodomicrobium vannielii TaxID=1069 RepID=UPI001917FA94|nr:Pls/PosA family non-ribosomal peptide synthetase [Rhodomicrobium vannielii]MBJ7533433.1 amino acid adenylation domain-containing protein [Rhodomicrobium vannielii ATCC 17100]
MARRHLLYDRMRRPMLLHHVFEQQAKRWPHSVAVKCDSVSLTYSQLDRLSSKIARRCIDKGVKPGSLVGIYFRKSVNLFAAILGVLKAGAGYVPLDPKFPAERIVDICEDARVSLVLSEGTLGREIADSIDSVEWLLLDADEERAARRRIRAARLAPVPVRPTSAAYAIYTSGSTGRPKGVKITHKNALAFVKAMKASYGIEKSDRIYQGFSVAFDASVEEIWAAFSTGATLVIPTEDIGRSPSDAADFIEQEGVSYFSTVPSFLAMIPRDLPNVRLLVLGGEACPPDLVNRWAKPGRRMLNTYGPTEATVVATLAECVTGQPVSIGTAIPGYAIHVLDERGNPVRPGEEGELYIGGAAVSPGYINRASQTAERFLPDRLSGTRGRLYRTSDLVRLGYDGELYFLGRIDGQIKLRGFRIELPEIEAVLLDHPQVAASSVNVFDVNGSKELGAFIVPNAEITSEIRVELADLLRRRVPEYMVPKYLDVIDALPLMTSGKVDRRQLPLPQTLLKGEQQIVAPETDFERGIAEVWGACLGVTSVSVEDDFFLDLGGHSLLAARVATEMRERLGLPSVSVRHLYQHRTIRALAVALGGHAQPAPDERSREGPQEELPSLRAFKLVPPWERWLCVGLQTLSIALYYLVLSAPVTLTVLVLKSAYEGATTAEDAALILTAAGFLIWPSMLSLSILLKWLVIGRYKPGRYPLWGLYYFRWWFVGKFQSLSWSSMFVGSPLMSLYFRAMGARVGKNCVIGTAHCSAFDLITIGDGACIGAETQFLGCRVEDGMLVIAPVIIGENCFIGQHCALGLNVEMAAGSALDDMSLLIDGTRLQPDMKWRGVPAAPADFDLPPANTARRGGEALWGLIHLALVYVMGYFLIVALLPPIALVALVLINYGVYAGAAALLVAVPLAVAWYIACAVLMKRVVLGRIRPGTYSVRSLTYLRHWFLSYLLNNTREILQPLYSTLFFPTVLRLLGAKIGKGVEVSTVMQFTPDLLTVKGGSFLADACIVGGARIHRGALSIEAVNIGARTFVGNSAFVPGGTTIGDDSLVGVLSTPPQTKEPLEANSRWLGSPGFELPPPVVQSSCAFADSKTYKPSRSMVFARACVDLLRICLPGWLSGAALVAFCYALIAIRNSHSPEETVLFSPLLSFASALGLLFAAAAVKVALRGTFHPVIKPLWSSYVWFTEVINGVFETLAANIMEPVLGTPYAGPCLGLFGCKVGRWVFMDTTLFSEFDLVEIRDHAALNLGATVQTHLFEDRVMKADKLVIGEGCTVGNMAVVLYSTSMERGAVLGPLSVLMKGETLTPGSYSVGIPASPVPRADALQRLPVLETKGGGVSVGRGLKHANAA